MYMEFDTGSAALRLIRQKIVTGGSIFTMEEAFGLNSGRTDSDDSGECVVCMTNPKNTLAKPCKHVSLCHECANVVMTKDQSCPICRQTIVEIIPLILNSPE